MVDLVYTQRTDGRFSFEDQRAVPLARRLACRQLEERRYVENGQDRPVQIAQPTEYGRCCRNSCDEAEGHDLANPPQLDRVTRGTDREHDHVAQFSHT